MLRGMSQKIFKPNVFLHSMINAVRSKVVPCIMWPKIHLAVDYVRSSVPTWCVVVPHPILQSFFEWTASGLPLTTYTSGKFSRIALMHDPKNSEPLSDCKILGTIAVDKILINAWATSFWLQYMHVRKRRILICVMQYPAMTCMRVNLTPHVN